MSDGGIRNGTRGEWGGLTFDKSCLDMLRPNEVALPVALARTTLTEACSMDGPGAYYRGHVGDAGGACTEVVLGSRRMSRRSVERPEPRKIALHAAEGVGGRNGRVV